MKRKATPAALATIICAKVLCSCASPRTDAHGHILPSDTRHLQIETAAGTISFTRSIGWRIIQLAERTNPTCVVGYVGPLNHKFVYGRDPDIAVYWDSGRGDPRAAQDALHAEFLREMRTHLGRNDDMRGYEAGSYYLQTVHTASGRAVDIYFYAGAPFLDLWVLVPERGGVTQICLQATKPTDISRHYDSFVALVQSYRFQ